MYVAQLTFHGAFHVVFFCLKQDLLQSCLYGLAVNFWAQESFASYSQLLVPSCLICVELALLGFNAGEKFSYSINAAFVWVSVSLLSAVYA